MKRTLPFLFVGFGVALAVIIGQKMSSDAMSIMVGVAVGVAASVPTSLLLVALLRRERSVYRPDPAQQPLQPPAAPNIIMLDPSQFQRGQQPQLPVPPEYLPQGGVPEIKVVGRNDW